LLDSSCRIRSSRVLRIVTAHRFPCDSHSAPCGESSFAL
jgi:hypothetical protein